MDWNKIRIEEAIEEGHRRTQTELQELEDKLYFNRYLTDIKIELYKSYGDFFFGVKIYLNEYPNIDITEDDLKECEKYYNRYIKTCKLVELTDILNHREFCAYYKKKRIKLLFQLYSWDFVCPPEYKIYDLSTANVRKINQEIYEHLKSCVSEKL